MWFWEILGIEPTDDKTAIKRAYTKLAHNTNPEDDPEGYAKLHDAYRAALDYASGKYIFIENIEDLGADEEPAGTGKPAFDFSSVRDPNDPFTFNVPEIKNAIKNYRDANHIGSFAELFDLEKQELLNISAFLFKLYSALAVKTDDPGIWNDFFDEPIISYAINDENFRGFLTDSFAFLSKPSVLSFINRTFTVSIRSFISLSCAPHSLQTGTKIIPAVSNSISTILTNNLPVIIKK